MKPRSLSKQVISISTVGVGALAVVACSEAEPAPRPHIGTSSLHPTAGATHYFD
jgi:hypothetical protein